MAGIDANCVLMLHMNGADTSTTFTDSEITPKTATAGGNAQIDTAQSKFGGGSGLFDGAGDYVTLADSADWDFGTGDFTIDFWARWSGKSGDDYLFTRNATSVNFFLKYDNTLPGFKIFIGGSLIKSVSFDPTLDTWYHIAYERYSGNIYLFINGTATGGATANSSNISYTDAVYIGTDEGATGGFNGWLDEYRVSNVGRYGGSNFTPPIAEYSLVSNNSNFLSFF